VPRDGERAIDLVPPALAGVSMPALARDALVPPRPLVASESVTPEDAAWINARTCRTPVGPSLDALVLRDPRALALPVTYVFFRRTPATYPCAQGRARLDAEGIAYREVDAGHDAPITAPRLVADVLLAVAAE
jgi:hypothetical protein